MVTVSSQACVLIGHELSSYWLGVQDVLAVHGGDPLSDPAHKHMYGRIILFSGADGRLLRWIATPDRRESYYPPQVSILIG